MNKLNSLVIEGEIVSVNNEEYITIAYERNTCNATYVYYFNVRCNVEVMKLKVGYQIRVVGRLEQYIFADRSSEVYIVAEHIEISNKEEREFIPNE